MANSVDVPDGLSWQHLHLPLEHQMAQPRLFQVATKALKHQSNAPRPLPQESLPRPQQGSNISQQQC